MAVQSNVVLKKLDVAQMEVRLFNFVQNIMTVLEKIQIVALAVKLSCATFATSKLSLDLGCARPYFIQLKHSIYEMFSLWFSASLRHQTLI